MESKCTQFCSIFYVESINVIILILNWWNLIIQIHKIVYFQYLGTQSTQIILKISVKFARNCIFFWIYSTVHCWHNSERQWNNFLLHFLGKCCGVSTVGERIKLVQYFVISIPDHNNSSYICLNVCYRLYTHNANSISLLFLNFEHSFVMKRLNYSAQHYLAPLLNMRINFDTQLHVQVNVSLCGWERQKWLPEQEPTGDKNDSTSDFIYTVKFSA